MQAAPAPMQAGAMSADGSIAVGVAASGAAAEAFSVST